MTSGRFTGANLLHLMLLAIEAGKPERAVADYLAHEKNAHDLSAKKLSTNVRTLLYAHLVVDSAGSVPNEKLAAARDRFRNAARNWHNGLMPIPYVGQLELARTLRVCAILTNQSLSMAELLRQVRGA